MRGRTAFTLLELVMTMAVMALMVYFAMAGMSSLLEASSISTGAQMISDCLAEARQDATAQNITVEVRVYLAPTGGAYSGLQLHSCDADGTKPPLGQLIALPDAAVIDATPAHSSLVTTNTQSPSPDAADTRVNPQTRCFHFLPSGATDLAGSGPWTLTVRAASRSDPAHFPSNWACLALDPITGRVQIYRP